MEEGTFFHGIHDACFNWMILRMTFRFHFLLHNEGHISSKRLLYKRFHSLPRIKVNFCYNQLFQSDEGLDLFFLDTMTHFSTVCNYAFFRLAKGHFNLLLDFVNSFALLIKVTEKEVWQGSRSVKVMYKKLFEGFQSSIFANV